MHEPSPGRERDREAARLFYERFGRLPPRPFRQRWLLGMEDVLAYRLSQTDARWRRAGVWLRATWDVVVLVGLERIQGGGGTGMGREIEATTIGWLAAGGNVGRAWASLRSSPLFTATAVGTLTLGIAATVATFSLVYGVLLAPLPYAAPDRLVAVWPERNFNAAMIRETAARTEGLEAVGGIAHWTFFIREGDVASELDGALVTKDYFDVLGVPAALGRTFRPDETIPGQGDVAVLSHAMWMRDFGGDPAVLGRTVGLSGPGHDRHTVIGVMPQDFRPVTGAPEVWLPLEATPSLAIDGDDTWFIGEHYGRLAPGVTLEQAQAQLGSAAHSIQREIPDLLGTDEATAATVQPLGRYVAGDLVAPLWLGLGAVILVLLVACANVSNLLLARGEARSEELAVRSALGAGRGQIVGLLLAESLLLALGAGLLGTGLSFVVLEGLVALAPKELARLSEASVNGVVLSFALGLTGLASLLAGVVPAARGSGVDAAAAMGRARSSSGARGSRLIRGLVTGQIALAVVVATASGLMLRSLTTLLGEETGLEAEGLLTMRVWAPWEGSPGPEELSAFYR
ncbi:MAG: ABC transporter permease, partial [Gemmatimonadota bacterium]